MKRKPKRKMNVKLLRRIQRWLMRLRHPEHFDMNSFGEKGNCGTSYCIAGKALQLKGYELGEGDFYSPKGKRVRIEDTAASLLGLTLDEASRLFYQSNWPPEFRGDRTPQEAVRRIEHFIETEGQE